MTQADQETIYLKDYEPYPFSPQNVHLTFQLAPEATRVLSRIEFVPAPDAPETMFLHGEKLKLISCMIDGQGVEPHLSDKGMELSVPAQPFVFECEVEINPKANTSLDGLYLSKGMYCTQCEAEGFRKITYYPDRPDVMSVFTVRIEAKDLPILLSNGNLAEQGEGYALWHDPWKKPSYLFALVGGDLVHHPDRFTTMSGKDVELNIWVRPGDEDKCAFGMEALKTSMRWDEEVYGREYDLDIFNIVAVDDFNMGAMENKGLNIFNSAAILANPKTTTDGQFERIEAIIAHEYFHNWTGNRITCRDWFQLSLKEGLTVFRDAQFTSDLRSAPVKRIDDAIRLRSVQFPEDSGPLAHPVRPESFVEINNFYTATIYEKGAEVIAMLKRIVGDEAYAKALDLYFERHDGDAATIEDWLKVFEDTTGQDLTQFKNWYQQAGTPHVSVTEQFENGTFTLTFEQKTAPTPGQTEKTPQVIPIAVGLLSQDGTEIQATKLLKMTEERQSFDFTGLKERPVASVLRHFSAPVQLHHPRSDQERMLLLAHDSDPFNTWDANNQLQLDLLADLSTDGTADQTQYLEALALAIGDNTRDPAFRAQLLSPPSSAQVARHLQDQSRDVDPLKIYHARRALDQELATQHTALFERLYEENQIEKDYKPNAAQSGARALANAALYRLTQVDEGECARQQLREANNMTQELSALSALLSHHVETDEHEAFYERWKHERLVINNWFALQIGTAAPDDLVKAATRLTQHNDFELKNPNRFRSVIGAFGGAFAGFHHPSGSGYAFMADWLIKSDVINPQMTARLCSAFQQGPFSEDGKIHMRNAIDRLLQTDELSVNTTEMAIRIRQTLN